MKYKSGETPMIGDKFRLVVQYGSIGAVPSGIGIVKETGWNSIMSEARSIYYPTNYCELVERDESKRMRVIKE